MNRWSHRSRGLRGGRNDTSGLAARLAPPEERALSVRRSKGNGGAGVLDAGRFELSGDSTKEANEPGTFHPPPVVAVILAVVLAYILFITWLIATGPPPKPKPKTRAVTIYTFSRGDGESAAFQSWRKVYSTH